MQLVELNPLKAAAIFAVFKIPHQYIFPNNEAQEFYFPRSEGKKAEKQLKEVSTV